MRSLILVGVLGAVVVSVWSQGACSSDDRGRYLIICEDQYYGWCFQHAQRLSNYHPAYDTLEFSVFTLTQIAQSGGGYQPRSYKQPPTTVLESSPSHQLPDSTCIKRFVKRWVESIPASEQGCGKYLLIVGRGVPSYRFIPTKPAIKRWHRWVSYDDPYADVDDNGRLDFPVARICPGSFEDIRNWSDKVLETLLSDPNAPYHKRVLIVVEDGRINNLDGSYSRYWAEKLAYRRLPYYLDKSVVLATDIDPEYLRPQVLQDYILPIFNQGYGMVVGIGTYASVFDFVDFFSTKYANLRPEMLTNRGKYPVMLGFSCEIARWDTTARYARITDVFNFASNGGSVLCIGPTAVTIDSASDMFLDALVDSVFSGRYKTWGDAFVAAKNWIHWMRFHREIWWEYGLFGEPALPIRCYQPIEPAEVVQQEVKPTITLALTHNPVLGVEAGVKLMLSHTAKVKVSVYDVRGRLVRVVHEGEIDPGETVIRWDCKDGFGRRVSPGIYFIRGEVGPRAVISKLVILR